MNSGLVAGSHNTDTGGGSNYLCIDLNITYTYGRYQDGYQGNSGNTKRRQLNIEVYLNQICAIFVIETPEIIVLRGVLYIWCRTARLRLDTQFVRQK